MPDSVVGLAEYSRKLQNGLGGTMNVMVQTPSGLCNAALAIAASRAGACGVLSLDVPAELGRVESAITGLLRFGKGQVGVKVRSSYSEIENIVNLLDGESHVIVLIPDDLQSLEHGIEISRQRGLTIFLEATRPEHGIWAEKTGAAGIIAKGNEAGGWVSDETSLILLQTFLRQSHTPVWVHGGIGLHTIGACLVAGAAGVVLDSQLALTRESALPDAVKSAVRKMDGSETLCLGEGFGAGCRMYYRPGLPHFQELQKLSVQFAGDSAPPEAKLENLRVAIEPRIAWNSPEGDVWLLGQDAAFAAALADRYVTVGGVLEAFRKAAANHISLAASQEALRENAPLARVHHTTYPIVQGPMTRVSDRAEFCEGVAAAGALSMLALALMRGPEIGILLKNTQERMGSLPWGVGILGFVPADLRKEQIEAIRPFRPPFAIIAGGRPDQALDLEKNAISTYLHVPSPGLLQIFLEGGCRKFVFEGRECGGHVGPRTSFVLWDLMIDTILNCLPAAEVAKCQVLFAGGIHDSISGAMAAAIGSSLVEKGAKIGVLMGTAYLFTREAVETGGIVEEYQTQAIQCSRTTLLESGPGHSTRCVETPFCAAFRRDKERLANKGLPSEAVRQELEKLNVGRLRIASKGLQRNPRFGDTLGSPKLTTVGLAEQRSDGLYMIGQVAALRDKVISIRDLHKEVSEGSSAKLRAFVQKPESFVQSSPVSRQADVAIIGMSCLLPKAKNLQTYWENILNKVDAITEIPEDRWDWRTYYDPDPKARDKVYSRWGGFINPIPFDPLSYGMPPNTLASIEPLQLLTLNVVRTALEDAGYANRPFPRQRTSVILGVGGGVADLGQRYAVRSGLPMVVGDISPELLSKLPEWTEDSFPGILGNVAAGRVANRFDLGGVNYTVDAACASSLAAVYLATRELKAGTSDMVIVGGADTLQNPFAYLCFSKTHALSPRGRCRTFDEGADGIVISEGIAVLVLKRLADAERDGDRIYAVVKAVAGSSDGKDRGLTAPRPEGQMLALERAYAEAAFSPSTVGLIEAHGTGTITGDQAEVETLKRVFESVGAVRQGCAIGSVKSMIGHTKCTAGVAGLIKTALALHHKVFPPTINVEKPNPKARFSESPFYVNTEPRPWINGMARRPRRAGVSAFGFGGTNFHAVLEEYTGDFSNSTRPAAFQDWPSELLLWIGNSRQDLVSTIQPLEQALARGAQPTLRDLASTLYHQIIPGRNGLTLAIVATSVDDLRQKLVWAQEALKVPGRSRIHDPRGIYFAEEPLARKGGLAYLFPGQGSQYPDMLRDLSIRFPEVREQFELADRVLTGRLTERLSSYVFPPPRFNAEEDQARQKALTQTNLAQPGLGAASMGLFHLLHILGVEPNMVAGHSYGEYVALCAAGVLSEEALYSLSEARGRCIIEAAGQNQDLGTMAAVAEDQQRVGDILKSIEGVWIANVNAPRQTVISGTRQGIETAIQHLGKAGIEVRTFPVACAFHSPLVAPARDRLACVLSTVDFGVPALDVFSNSSAAPYPEDPKNFAALLAQHLVTPVHFAREIEAMYQAGARIFLEVGPRNVLTALVEQILGNRPYLAVAADIFGRPGVLQLHHTLGQLAADGVPVKLDRLYQGRVVRQLNVSALDEETAEKPLPPTSWLVHGGSAKPAREVTTPEAQKGCSEARPKSGNGKVQAPLGSVTKPTTVAANDALERDSHSPLPPPPARQPSLEPAALEQAHGTSAVSHAAPPGNGAGQVMLQFQQLMNRFLETQSQVMLAYLRGSPSGRNRSSGVLTSTALPDSSAAPVFAREPDQPAKMLPRRADESASATQELRRPKPSITPNPIDPSTATEPITSQPQSVTDKERLTKQLLAIVSDRTGYPPEMLDQDLNIEADLGIDSIKRVEILGAFLRSCLPSDQQKTQEAMEKLTGIKTLRGIVDLLSSILQLRPGGEIGDPLHDQRTTPDPEQPECRANAAVEVPRFLLSAAEIPLRGHQKPVITDKVFVIIDDECGVATALAEALRNQGARTALVRFSDQGVTIDQDIYTANLADPAVVCELLETVRYRQGPIAGIVHLLPLKAATKLEEMDLAGWRRRLDLEVKSLLCLARGAAVTLKQASEAGGSWFLAVTPMGGSFASGAGNIAAFFPGHGGVAGFIKTLAVEWPSVRCKVVDLQTEASASTLARCILGEMIDGDNEVEVGYKGSHRLVLRARPDPLKKSGAPQLAIDSSSILLVTGGARGITSEIACDLAARYRPTILLVGRSPLPQETEPAETSSLTSAKAIKAVLMEQMHREGQSVKPSQVETACANLLRDREIRDNLAAMEQAGASVRYYQVDVRDESAFGKLIDELYKSYGRIDGVIHGAGIIEDKLVEDKNPESFDRVFDTKIASAFILSRKLRPNSLKFLVFFSSVAGRFGNRGQSDYTAANEVLNKLAVYLDCQWPGRVLAVNWGPWGKTGMVSPEVQNQFAKRGVQLIPPAVGCRLLDEELLWGRKGETEVIVGDGPWERLEAAGPSSSPSTLPLVNGVALRSDVEAGVEAVWRLDPAKDSYLQDHRLDGQPVFPMAMATELMAEVVQRGWPEWKVIGIRSLQVLRGIVLADGARDIRIIARAQTDAPDENTGLEIEVQINELDQRTHPCYRATVQLGKQFPSPPAHERNELANLRPFSMTVDDSYERWLFHGSCFRRISAIEGINEQGICGILVPSAPSDCLSPKASGQWLIDPVLLDCGFQLAILWERAHHDMTPLPSRFASYRVFGSASGLPVRCYLRARTSSGGQNLVTDIDFLDQDGRLLGYLEQMEFSCSTALNRLAGGTASHREDR